MITLLYILLYSFYAGLFLLLIWRWKFFDTAGIDKKNLAFFFALKAVAGIALTLLYTYYYTDQGKVDIYRYFNDSKIISSVIFASPRNWLKIISGIGTYDPETFEYFRNTMYFSHPEGDLVTNNSFIIRVISLLNYFSGYNIYINTLFFNFITFITFTALFKSLQKYFAEFKQVLFLPLFLLPSLVFWGSGLLKESLMMAGIAIYLSAWLKNDAQFKLANILLLAAALLIVLLTKSYVAILLLMCSLFLPVSSSFFSRLLPLWRRLVLAVCFALAGWYCLGPTFCEKIIEKRNDFVELSIAEHAGSALDKGVMTANCESFHTVLPAAFVNSFFRPFLWDRGNLFQLLFAAENLLQLFLILGLLLFRFKKPAGPKLYVAMFCFAFAVMNYLVIGVTIPVLGAIVHYRIAATPFLLLSVLCIVDLNKLKALLRFER